MTLPHWLATPLGWLLAIAAGIAAALTWRSLRDRRVVGADRREQDRRSALARARELLAVVAAAKAADAARRNTGAARRAAEPAAQADADAGVAAATDAGVTPAAAAEAQTVSDELLRRGGQ